MVFEYGEKEMDWLSRRDARMGRLIGRVGKIRRELQPDLFQSLTFNIVGQQISMAAQKTVWGRLEDALGGVTPRALAEADSQALRQMGLNGRKVEYLQELARKVACGRLDLEALARREDEEVIRELSAQKGVGVWTAEMMLIFSLGRPDVLSWGDLGIRRGMEMLYGKAPTRQDFERYKKRYSPYGTLASFYLWELAGGRAEGWQSAARFSRLPEKESREEGRRFGWYDSPLGPLLLESDGRALKRLEFWEGERAEGPAPGQEDEVLRQARSWLDAYFRGEDPGRPPLLEPEGTEFQRAVWRQLARIPYGRLTSYGEIARALQAEGRAAAPRAVGGAVGKNHIGLMLPCHRVVGTSGKLTGFSAGLWRKEYLLELEKPAWEELYPLV